MALLFAEVGKLKQGSGDTGARLRKGTKNVRAVGLKLDIWMTVDMCMTVDICLTVDICMTVDMLGLHKDRQPQGLKDMGIVHEGTIQKCDM
jgi:hypothetical protein